MSFAQFCLSLAGVFLAATLLFFAMLRAWGKPSPFWLALQSATALYLTIGFLGLSWGPLEEVQDLFSPTPFAYVTLVLFVAFMVLVVGRLLGSLFNRLSGKSDGFFSAAIVLTVMSPFYSHSIVWGALYYLPTQAVSKQAIIAQSGYKHASRAEAHRGDWIDVRFTDKTRLRQFISREQNSLRHGNITCPLDTAKAGDTIEIQGRQTIFGLAAISFAPVNARLLEACETAPEPH